jgi:hypothetical protein
VKGFDGSCGFYTSYAGNELVLPDCLKGAPVPECTEGCTLVERCVGTSQSSIYVGRK